MFTRCSSLGLATVVLAAGAVLASSLYTGLPGPAPAPGYVLSSFNGAYPNDHFALFFSLGGIDWTGGAGNYSTPLRDPSITRINGTWWLAHTSIPDVSSFQVASSPDLRTWSNPITVTVLPLSALHCWAPEWFIDSDGSPHVTIAITQGGNLGPFTIYELHPTNADFTSWSAPSPLVITGEGNPIDPYLTKVAGTYYLWYVAWGASNPHEYIQYASSSTLTGTYTLQRTGNWAGWGGLANGLEGPSLIQLADRWRLYFDDVLPLYSSDLGNIAYSDSFDNWATWTHPVLISTGQIRAKHGTVIPYP